MSHTVIALTGPMRAGKSSIARRLRRERYFFYYSTSERIFQVLELFRLPRDRSHGQKLGNGMMHAFGGNVFLHPIVQQIQERGARRPDERPHRAVIEALRYPEHVEHLRKQFPGMVIVAVYADIHLRYERAQSARGKPDELSMSFEEFEALHNESTEERVIETMALADVHLTNEGNLDDCITRLYQELTKAGVKL